MFCLKIIFFTAKSETNNLMKVRKILHQNLQIEITMRKKCTYHKSVHYCAEFCSEETEDLNARQSLYTAFQGARTGPHHHPPTLPSLPTILPSNQATSA